MITKFGSILSILNKLDNGMHNLPSNEELIDSHNKSNKKKVELITLPDNTIKNAWYLKSGDKKKNLEKFDSESKLSKTIRNKLGIGLSEDFYDKIRGTQKDTDVLIGDKNTLTPSVVAHELGHAVQHNKNGLPSFASRLRHPVLPRIGELTSSILNTQGATRGNMGLRALGTTLGLASVAPELIDEYQASRNARKILKDHGATGRPLSLDGAFWTTYALPQLSLQAMSALSPEINNLAQKRLAAYKRKQFINRINNYSA